MALGRARSAIVEPGTARWLAAASESPGGGRDRGWWARLRALLAPLGLPHERDDPVARKPPTERV